MIARRITVFFYGLFMDTDLLRAKGAQPERPRPAVVRGFSLRIGARATLVPDAAGSVHGILMELAHEDIDRLYADASVSTYRPEGVFAEVDDTMVPALCFNLVAPPRPEEANAAYAMKLQDLARRVGLPADYIARIA